MNLYLVRHGQAAPVGGTVQRDADRVLTKQGEEDISTMAALLARCEGSVHCILSSPLVRAVQTAGILSSGMHSAPEVKPTERLAPGFQPKHLLDELTALAGAGAVIAVGHQPDLGVFLAHMIAEASPLEVAIPPGTALKLTLDPSAGVGGATLRWILSPEDARRLIQQEGTTS